jgi:hypothetical protein
MPQFMRDSLDTARAMALAGKPSEEIRAVTGWFPGKYDGKMRWEIPDNKASFIERKFKTREPNIVRGVFPTGGSSFTEKPDGYYVAEIDGKPDWQTASETREDAENRYYDIVGRETRYGFGVNGKLFDVLEHGNLFRAYPSAKEINVVFKEVSEGFHGQFIRSTNTINISSSIDREKALSVLLHEIQHWVQAQEGFAKGANPRMERNTEDTRIAADMALGIKSWMRHPAGKNLSIDEIQRTTSNPTRTDLWPFARQLVSRSDKELKKLTSRKEIGFGGYRKVAGEIEARDIQARMGLTEKQRKAIEPYSSENISPEAVTAIEGEAESASSSQAQPDREVYVPPVTRKYRKRQAERQAGQAAAQKLKDMIRETFPGVTVQEDNSDPDSVLYYDPEKDSIVVNPEEFYRLLPENPTPDAIDRILGALMTHEVVHNAVVKSINADPANNDKFYAVEDWLFSGNLWKQVVRRYNWDREMTDQEVEDFVSDNGREYVTHEFLRMQAELITQGRTTEALILLGKNPPQNIIDGIIAYLQKMADQLMAWIQRRSSNGAIDEMLDLINQHLDVLRSPTAQDRINHLVADKSNQNHSNRKLFANAGGRVVRSIRETETRFTESFLASRPFYSSTVRTALENLTYEGETMKELFDEATQLLVNTMRAGGPGMGAEAAYRQVSGYTPQEGMDSNLRVAVQMVTADWFEQMSRGFRSRNTPEAQRAAEYYDQRTADIRVEVAEKSLSPAGQTLSIASYALRKLKEREFGRIYKKPTTAAQQQKLDGDPAAQEIEQDIEDAVDTAADNTVDKADKLINKLEDKAKAATPDTGLDKTGEDAVKDLLDTTEDIKKEATAPKGKTKKTGEKKRARKEDEDKSNQPKAIDPERVIERVAEKLEKVIKNAGLTAEQRAAAKRNPFFETILTGTTLATVRKQFEDLLSAQQISDTDSEKAKEAKLRRAIVGLVAQVQELDIAKAAFEEAKARAIDAAFEGDIEMDSDQLEEIESIEFDDTKIPNAAKVLKGAVNIRELVRSSLKAQRTTVSRLAADIAEATKLSLEQADVVARALEAEYKKAAKVEIEKAIEKLVQSNDPAIRKAIKSKSTHDKLFEAANLGALRRETVWNAIAQNYDLPSFDPAFVREIEKRSQRIQDLPENSQQRNLETRLLMTDIAYRQVSEAKGVQKFLRNLDVFMAMWKAGILSGPPTQAVNFGFSHINLLLNASAKAQALARMGRIQNNKDAKSYLGYLTTLLMGTYSQLGRAKNEAINALNYGYSRFNNEKIESLGILEGFKFDPNNKFNLKNVISLYKFVGRFMQASDVFNSSMASEMAQHAAVESYILQNNLTKEEAGKLRANVFDNSQEIREKAVKQADEEAARGDFGPAGSKADRLRLSRIEEIIERQREKHISGVIERGRSEGERISYNNPANRLLGFVMRGLFAPLNRTLRVTQPLMPFPNTIANLLNTTIDYTPYGYLRAKNISVSDLLAKSGKLSDEFSPKELKEGTLEYEEAIAKAHMGSIGIAAIFGLVLMGWFDRDEEPDEEPFFEVTAEGPSDLTAREQLRSTGWMPYTVKIGGLRLRYTDWPALNIALGAFGTLTDRYVYDKKRDFTPGDILPAIISVFSTTLDRNMLSGMADFFDIVNNPNTKGANTLLRLTTGFVGGVSNPNLLRWTRNTFGADETGMVPRIEQRTLAGKFASVAPFSGGYSQASLNVFGEPIRSFASEATTNRFGSFLDKEHPIITPLAKKGLFLTDPSYQVVFSIPRGRKTEDYKLTPYEQRDFSRIRGPILKKLLKPSEVSRITALASRDYDTAKEELQRISTAATQQAKAIYAKRRGWAR